MGKYFDAVQEAMTWISKQPNTLFLGQAVAYPGTFMHATLEGVPAEQRLEMPVCESFQMQTSIGLALAGVYPISIFPRQNFLLLATGDMSNLLDKLVDMSGGKVSPAMIIRTAAGTTKPIHPGHQHVGNYAETFRTLFKNIVVKELHEPEDILPAYQEAYSSKKPTLLIEFGDHYGDK
jgi:pyruvate/2-oxoglutarate/acetoin dehydrogenase E1 component